MMDSDSDGKILLPHHVQQELCATRLPYRQGRKLTAVKVYTINNESKHLLVFGVPSLNLRQEAKALFAKFGRMIQFTISTDHPNEAFTETYKVVYERIQSARIAKRMLDTKNFYGGSLHVCYAPEYESIEDIREKLKQRKRDIHLRLRNLVMEETETKSEPEPMDVVQKVKDVKLNMGEINVIGVGKQIREVVAKRKWSSKRTKEKKFKGNVRDTNTSDINETKEPEDVIDCTSVEKETMKRKFSSKRTNEKKNKGNIQDTNTSDINETKVLLDVIDCTSVEKETVTDIDVDKTLNYDSFGSEVVKKVPAKPVNKIQFYIGNKISLSK